MIRGAFGTIIRIPLLCAAATLAASAIAHFNPLSRAEAILADHYRFAARHSAATGIVLVTVDEEAIRQTGRFPYDRSQLAKALEALNGAGAQRIFIDGSFSTIEDAAGDDAFENALRALGPRRIALPVSRTADPQGRVTYTSPLQRFSQHTTLATTALLYDADNRLRRISALPERAVPLSADWLLDPARPIRPAPLALDFAIDVSKLQRIGIADVAAGNFDPLLFMGQRVVIGLQVSAPQYIVNIPSFRQTSRIELIAQAAETIHAGRLSQMLAGWQILLLAFLFALVASAFIATLPVSLILALCASAALFWLAYADMAMALTQTELPLLMPALTLLLLWAGMNLRSSWLMHWLGVQKHRIFGAGRNAVLGAVDIMTSPAVVFDRDGRVLRANAAFGGLGLTLESKKRLPGLSQMVAEHGPARNALNFNTDIDGTPRHFDVSLSWVSASGKAFAMAAFNDVTRQRQREQELSGLAFTDALTGLANRAAFNAALQKREANAAQSPFGILIIDLDGFKLVNDSLGHHAGDELLRAVGGRIRDTLREDALCARIGGDEFAIIASGEDDAVCVRIATRILMALIPPFRLAEGEARIGASIGIALCPAHAALASEAMKFADAAMYVAKKCKPAYAVHSLVAPIAAKQVAA